jgi:NADP-dependent 3-hydroxy acid dehydrogenase YdfG
VDHTRRAWQGAAATERFADGCAVVTGASSDIGAAITLGLLDLGLRVIAIGRDHGRLSAKMSRYQGSDRFVPVLAELTTPPGLAAVEAAVREQGRVDLLVLGAGVYYSSDDPGLFDVQFRANVLAPYALSRAMAPYLKQLVVLNSTQGLKAAPGAGQYAATQHAMRAIADSLRDEMNALGVRVLSLFLGRVATERQREIFALEGRAYTPERLIQPQDVAEMVLAAYRLPRTAEVTDMHIRPMRNPL